MKIGLFLISTTIICFFLTACVSDAQYKELEERVSNIESRLDEGYVQTEVEMPKENTSSNIKEEDDNPESAEEESQKEQSFVYAIDNLSEQQVCDEVMYYLNNLPYQNQSYDEYAKTLKVTPVDNYNDGKNILAYYFYNITNNERPVGDVIREIRVFGTYPEMDGTIGLGDKNYQEIYGVMVELYIMDYNRAAKIYDLLYDQISPNYVELENSKEGTSWSGSGTVYVYENSGVNESFVNMSKDNNDCFRINAKISRKK